MPTPARSWIDLLTEHDPGLGSPAADEALLEGFPVRLGRQDTERNRQLLTELEQVAADEALSEARLKVPRRLLELANDMTVGYGPGIEAANRRRDEAFAVGEERVDVRYPLAPGSRADLLNYARLMEQIDVYCRAGTLHTPVTPVTLYALRRWIVEEFVRQYDGEPPRRWDGPLG